MAELIVEIEPDSENGRYFFHFEKLENLLKQVTLCSIAVISIIGEQKSGKSFILNYLHDFLTNEDEVWLEDKEAPLKKYFSNERRNENKKYGIWFSEPIKVPNTNKVIILMDTNIDPDNNIIDDIRVIYDLSILLSSHVIFNVKNDLTDEALEPINIFVNACIDYTLLNDKKPFQNLLFLIRDWDDPRVKIGEQFLKQKNIGLLKQFFETTQAYLLPPIGEKASQSNFNGSVRQMRPMFVNMMRQLFNQFLIPDDIKIKEEMDQAQQISCEKFLKYFESYSNIFKHSMNFSYELLRNANDKIALEIFLSGSKNKYEKTMLEFVKTATDLIPSKDLKRQSEKVILEIKSELYDFSLPDDSIEMKLDDYFDSKIDDLITENENKSQEILKKNAMHIIQSFQEYFTNAIDQEEYDNDDLEDLMEERKGVILVEFNQKFSILNKDFVEYEKLKLINNLNDITSQVKRMNKAKLKEKSKNISGILVDSIEKYSSEFDKFFESNEMTDDFVSLERDIRQKTFNEFNETLSKRSISLDDSVKYQLETKLKSKKKDIEKRFEETVNMRNNEIKKIAKNSIELYKEYIGINMIKTLTDLDSKHEMSMKFVVNQFKSDCKSFKSIEQDLEHLQDSIANIYEDYKEILKDKQGQIKNIITEKMDELKGNYIKDLTKYLMDETLTEEKIKKYNKKKISEITEQFDDWCSEENVEPDKIDKKFKNFEKILKTEYQNIKEDYEIKMEKAKIFKAMRNVTTRFQNDLGEFIERANSANEVNNHHKKIRPIYVQEFQKCLNDTEKIDKDDYLSKFDNQLDQFYRTYLLKFNDQSDYKQKLDSFIEDLIDTYQKNWVEKFNKNQCYSDETLDEFNNQWKTESFVSFEKEYQGYKDFSDMGQKLLDNLSTIYKKLQSKNNDTRHEMENKLDRLIDQCCEQYMHEVKNNLVTVTCEDELTGLHERIRNKNIRGFNNSSKFDDKKLQNKYEIKIKTVLDQHLDRMRDYAIEKISLKFVEQYNKEIQKLIEKDENKSEESIQISHEIALKNAILGLRSELFGNFNSDADQYCDKLSQLLSIEFSKIASNQSFAKISSERTLKGSVDEMTRKYENLMIDEIQKVNSELELRDVNQTTKSLLNSEFASQNTGVAKNIFDLHSNDLEKKFENIFQNKILLNFQTHLAMNETKNKLIKTEIQRSYKDLMTRHKAGKFYLKEKELEDNHQKVLKLLLKNKRDKTIPDTEYQKLINEAVKISHKNFKDGNSMNNPDSHAIGIDLGTSNSCVAIYNNGSVTVIPNENGGLTTPSIVAILEDKEVIGDQAKNDQFKYPKNTIYSTKRLIGRAFTDSGVQKNYNNLSYEVIADLNDNPMIKVPLAEDFEKFYPENIATKILSKMRKIATDHLKTDVTDCVITVPAYFKKSQIEMTKTAAEAAGLNNLYILPEPIAAAFAYSLNLTDEFESRYVVVFDYGGGTLDVAVLEIFKGNIRVKEMGGDLNLGGDDIDQALVKHCVKSYKENYPYTFKNKDEEDAALARLRIKCEECKCKLSSEGIADILVEDFSGKQDLKVMISREKFEELIDDYIQRSMDILDSVMEKANVQSSDIEDIILVGGTTRIPKIQRILSGKFDDRPLNYAMNPDEAVAKGASMMAAILNGGQASKQHNFNLS